MGPVETLLRRAGELITDPDRCCVGAYAVDADGQAVSHHSPNAVRWCAVGALMRATRVSEEGVRRVAHEILNGVAINFYYPSASGASDSGLIADLYSDAIEACAELGL